jgi:beta-glucanase (GH16 family)
MMNSISRSERRLVTILALVAAASARLSSPPGYCDEAGFSMLWADEFDSLDTTAWTLSNNTVREDSACREAMCVAENVGVRDGALVLTAKREQRGWSNFTTGAVRSQDKKFFGAAEGKPVRFCVSGKLPGTPQNGAGFWPAYWLMPNTAACWPDNGELDLMEEINGDGVEHFTYHVSPRNATACHGGPVQQSMGSNVAIPTMATAWHEYAVEISMGQFVFVVDSVVVFNSTSNPELAVHDVPWYVILNFAIGGPWPKAPNASTAFPAETLVDYVRVSQRSA